jgi:hypothetical protein
MTAPVVAETLHDAAQDPTTWTDHPAAEALVAMLLAGATEASGRLTDLSARLASDTATDLVDWLDHIVAPVDEAALIELGWRLDGDTGLFRHPAAQLPSIATGRTIRVGLRVDDVDLTAAAFGSAAAVDGPSGGPLRTVALGEDGGIALVAVERRSYAAGLAPSDAPAAEPRWSQAVELWRARPLGTDPAVGDDPEAALAGALDRARATVDDLGADLASAAFLHVERERWEQRNSAARATRRGQDRFGLGWANRDHHTFRSSRVHFAALLALLDVLGFERREQFHAGADAGWGAQVLEHPGNGEVVFADVDLAADELGTDLTRPLPPAPLGPVGTWCAVHGDSVLAAGMHHLAVRCRFDDYPAVHPAIDLQAPFSELDDLRQRFTAPDPWPVDAGRVRSLLDHGDLTDGAADRLTTGAVPGSHLELIERRFGFKGFNQTSVSRTITDNDLR